MARSKAQAREQAEAIVGNWAFGAALTGWIPGSTFFLAAADMAMIRQVADAYGIGFIDKDAVLAHIGGLVGSAVGGGIIAETVGNIPLFGSFGKSVMMGIKAQTIGDAVIEYFEAQSPLA